MDRWNEENLCNNAVYPAIKPSMKTGTEMFVDGKGTAIATLLGFWQWAYSDLMGNSERGILAEFLVASALGLQSETRISWARYDLRTPEGIRIEIKTSGYIQTWEQRSLSKLVFDIRPTYGWNSISNEYDKEKKRQADLYVFCIHKHMEQSTLNPLDTRQWEFYVLSTKVLDREVPQQKRISLNRLLSLGARKTNFEGLAVMIDSEFSNPCHELTERIK